MRRVQSLVALVLVLVVVQTSISFGAVRGNDVKYVGGTLVSIPQDTEGVLDLRNEAALKFTSPKGSFEIPYDTVSTVEFGQKAGRRLGLAIALTPLALFSKKRRHFLSVGYKDAEGKNQGVVLELSKGLPRTVISILEARTGVKCDYESEEARKHVHG